MVCPFGVWACAWTPTTSAPATETARLSNDLKFMFPPEISASVTAPSPLHKLEAGTRALRWLVARHARLPEQEGVGVHGLPVLLGAGGADAVAGVEVHPQQDRLARRGRLLQAGRH